MSGQSLYIDCFSGIAGDMFLGALFDLADALGNADQVNPQRLEQALSHLDLPSWSLSLKPCSKHGLVGKKLRVLTPWGEEKVEDISTDHEHSHTHDHEHPHTHDHEHPHTHDHEHPHTHDHEHSHTHDHDHGLNFLEIKSLILESKLTKNTIDRAIKVFEVIAQAESRAHGISVEKVHFHEVGMLDSIIDVLGSAWCLDQLHITEIISAPPPVNRGWVRCAHGTMPLPAPATAFILEGIKTCTSPYQVELVTPTGAAMLKAWAQEVTSHLPVYPIKAIGFGAGERDLKDRPNLLRLFTYSTDLQDHQKPQQSFSLDLPTTSCWLYESNIDDMRAEDLAVATEQLFQAGALDVWQSPITMKKNRLGCMLSVLCSDQKAQKIEETLLFYSTSIGCRKQRMERKVLERRFLTLETQWGSCRIKVSRLTSKHLGAEKDLWRYKPELEDLKRLALSSSTNIETLRAQVHIELNSMGLTEDEDFWNTLHHES